MVSFLPGRGGAATFVVLLTVAPLFFGLVLATGGQERSSHHPATADGTSTDDQQQAAEAYRMIRGGLAASTRTRSTPSTLNPPSSSTPGSLLVPPQRSRSQVVGGNQAVATVRNELLLTEAKELQAKLSGLSHVFDDYLSSMQGDLDELPFDFKTRLSSVKQHTLVAEDSLTNLVAVLDEKIHGSSSDAGDEVVQHFESAWRDHRNLFQGDQESSKQDSSSYHGGGSWEGPPRARHQSSSSTLHEAILNGDMRYFETHFHQSPHFAKMRNRVTERHPHGRDLALAASSKRDQCNLLVSCARAMTTYDVIVFFYQDDIDFEKGVLDVNITRDFDDKNLIEKMQQIQNSTRAAQGMLDGNNESEGFGSPDDACDLLLAEFHQIVESDDGDRWYPGNVTSVCLAEGTTQYLQLKEITGKIGPAEIVDAVFSEFVYCTDELYNTDNFRIDHFTSETNFFFGSEGLQMPIKLNPDSSIRDKHGQLLAGNGDPNTFFEMKTLGGIGTSAYVFRDVRNFDGGQAQKCVVQEARDLALAHKQQIADVKKDATDNDEVPELPPKPTFQIKCEEYAAVEGLCRLVYTNLPENFEITSVCASWTTILNIYTYRCGMTACDVSLNALSDPNDAVQSDQSLALSLGERPSIGNLCGLATAIREDDTNQTTIPGYCCLDTPAHSTPWGRSYTCKDEAGEDRTITDCEHPASYLAGLRPQACDVYAGTWCPNPQSCEVLITCLKKIKIEANTTGTESPFVVSYIDKAPTVSDERSARQCGRLREYFGFDPLVFNDKNICQDVEQLAGSAGDTFAGLFDNKGNNPEGSPRLIRPKVPSTTSESGLKQRTDIFILQQVAGALEQVYETAANLECECLAVGCATVKNVVAPILSVIWFIILKTAEIYEFMYNEEVGLSDFQENEIYEATQVLYGNMQTQMDQINKIFNYVKPKTSSTDQKYAGCDGLDQNLEHGADDCAEDQYPPELVLLSGAVTATDCKSDEGAVCLAGMLNSKESAKAYLKSVVDVVDDCTAYDMLESEIEYLGGLCSEALWRITPQSIAICHEDDPIISGETQKFVLGFDSSKPIPTCGFTIPNQKDLKHRWVDDQTLLIVKGDGKLVNTYFSLDIEENCDGAVEIEAVVTSNEFTIDPMVVVVEDGSIGSSVNMKLFVNQESCKENDEVCLNDPTTDLRFYEVHLSAKDQAGNVGTTACRVLIYDEKKPPKNLLPKKHTMADLLSYVNSELNQSVQRFKLASLSLKWIAETETAVAV